MASQNVLNWLWAVTGIFSFSFVAFVGLSYIARAGEKIFHYLFTIALLVGSISYFAIASIGYARAHYIYWVVSFPVLAISLGLLSGISWATIIYHVFLAWVWIISSLASGSTAGSYKWGFYTSGAVAWILLAVGTLADGFAGARRMAVTRDYALLAGWTNLFWLLYLIAFGLAGGMADGGDHINPLGVVVFYSVLDVLLIPLLGFAVIMLSHHWDYGALNIAFTQYGRVNALAGTFPEKVPAVAPAMAPAGGVLAGGQAV